MIWGRKQQPAEACCPHGIPREKQCGSCLIEAHREQIDTRMLEQRKEIFEGEKVEGDFEYAWQVKRGEKREHLEQGQDMVLVDEKRKMTAVFDGLGGEGDSESGARASSLAAELLPEYYDRVLEYVKTKATSEDAADMIHNQIRLPENHPQYASLMEEGLKEFFAQPKEVQIAMLTMHRAIQELNPAVLKSGGQTTISAGITVELPDGRVFEIIGHLGDGGVVKVEEDGTATELVAEDSAIDLLLTLGEITPEQAKNPEFVYQGTKEQLKGKNIRELGRITTQSLGDPSMIPMPRVVATELKPGQSCVFVTDGQKDEIVDKEGNFDTKKIGKMVYESETPSEACKKINNEASKGPKRDDKGIVVLSRKVSSEEIETAEETEEEPEEISAEDLEEIKEEAA